jgi:hypothetical protein
VRDAGEPHPLRRLEYLALVSLLDGGCRLAPLMRERDIIGTYAAGFAESPAALLVTFWLRFRA